MQSRTTAPILPLEVEDGTINGFTDSEITELVKQNVKALLMTHPGERIMHPGFGVGIERYLFELRSSDVNTRVKSAINSQMRQYMPGINVLELTTRYEDDLRNTLFVKISYEIDFLKIKDQLELLLEY